MKYFDRVDMRLYRPTSIFFRAILFVALLVLFVPLHAAMASSLPVAQLLFSQTRPEPATQPSAQPLLASGDSRSLWLVRPLILEANAPGFEILEHPVNRRKADRDYWQPITRDQQRFFSGMPATITAANNSQGSQICVIMHDGQIVMYGAFGQRPLPHLPMGKPVASLGLDDEIVVLTRGPILNSQPASAPAATTSSATTQALREEWSLWIYRAGRWQPLASPGHVAIDCHKGFAPSASARVQLARQGDDVLLLWIEPSHAHQLYVRSLKLKDARAGWSASVHSDLPEDAQFFHALSIGQRVYVLWAGSDGRQQIISGGSLDSNFLFSSRQRIDRIPLGLPSTTPLPVYDMAIARNGDAISVLYEIASTSPAALGSLTLATTGRILYPAQDIAPDLGATDDSNVLQHSAMILLILLLAISLWQWRKRPMHPHLPTNLAVARLYQRVAAALIDLGLAFGAVVLIYKLYQDDLAAILMGWLRSLIQLENSPNAWPLVMMFVIYIVHVTISELLTCRTLGKWVLGIRVVAIDGTRPTKLSILLRNLMRVPELATRILLIYMVINEQRQRLGDLIARTTVVSDKPVGDESESSTPDGEE